MSMKSTQADYWIKHLKLKPHPEGGYYNEVFRSEQQVTRKGESQLKNSCTSIYYLLQNADFSSFHRLQSDEIWYFHVGSPLHIHILRPEGRYEWKELSMNETGSLSVVIEAGMWFAAEIPSRVGFSLSSCVVAPGFEFSEFELGEKEKLLEIYPAQAELIERFCLK